MPICRNCGSWTAGWPCEECTARPKPLPAKSTPGPPPAAAERPAASVALLYTVAGLRSHLDEPLPKPIQRESPPSARKPPKAGRSSESHAPPRAGRMLCKCGQEVFLQTYQGTYVTKRGKTRETNRLAWCTARDVANLQEGRAPQHDVYAANGQRRFTGTCSARGRNSRTLPPRPSTTTEPKR
jgi:hypothetical protein